MTTESPETLTKPEAGALLPPATGSKTTYSTYHMCVDIKGVLRWPDKDLRRLFTDDDGQMQPGKLVRDWLKLQLAQGKRVLPLGEKCEGWSDITGCPGHPSAKSPNLKLSDGSK